jgi:hypothetical protein
MTGWICPECGAYVDHSLKELHKDEHDALIDALKGFLTGQKMLLAIIRDLETRIQALERARNDAA